VDTLSLKSPIANAGNINRKWHIIDAENQTLGRFCSQVATLLRGKHKAIYTPHVDAGDFVIIINAGKFKLSGNKMLDKEIITFSGYPGGQKITNPKDLLVKHPGRMVENAVKGMLPKNKMGRAMYKKLFVYAGAEHPHASQNPQPYTIKK
jgi:large subunit ribosomal protein L13